MSMSRVSPSRVIALLAAREWKRLLRQPARLLATILTPVLIWMFMGSGFAQSIRPESLGDLSYDAFLLPGMLTLVAVFGSIFSSIPVIDDRQSGWLQTVLSSPSPRWAVAVGLIVGGASTAFMQAALLLTGLALIRVDFDAASLLILMAGLALTCIAMAGLGLAFAWRSESTASFHSVMNLIIMPMWLLSGAFFPPTGASHWLSAIVAVNPLTWLTNLMRTPLSAATEQPMTTDVILSCVFAFVMVMLATIIVAQRPRR